MTSITVEAVDMESGLKGGNYSYVDVTEQTTIGHGEVSTLINNNCAILNIFTCKSKILE